MIARFLTVLLALMALTTGVLAQADGPLDVEVTAGIDGYVAPDAPGVILIEVSSPVLFVGSVETRVGNHRNRVAIEIPADGRKIIEVPFPAPGAAATARVFFYDEDGDEVQKDSLSLQAPVDALVVGVVGAPDIERILTAVRSTPVGLPVEPVSVSLDQLDDRLTAFRYLVVPSATASQLTTDQIQFLGSWADDGGRLIMAESSALGLVTGDLTELGPATIGIRGDGETILVDLSAVDESGWATLLRDIPRPASAFTTFQGGEFDQTFGLFEAASSRSDASLPELSWLLAGLAAYVALVGPINMFLLRRLRRTQLTWVTVPVISILTVSLFWWGGPKSGDDSTIIHSSVVYYDDDASRATSGIVLVAGTSGNYRVELQEGWSAFPSEIGMFGEQRRQSAETDFTNGVVGIEFDLPNLGTGAISADWTPSQSPLSSTWTEQGDSLQVTVTNESSIEFWAWGIVRGGQGQRANEQLAADGSGSLSIDDNLLERGDPFETPIVEAFFQGGGFFGGEQEQVLWPLSNVASTMGILAEAGTYIWAFTDEFELDMTLDGAQRSAEGPALLVMSVDAPAAISDTGEASAEILSIEGADFVEGGGTYVYIGGADTVFLSYTVPDGVSEVDIVDSWGGGQGQSEYQMYDWTAGQFEIIESLNDVDVSGYRSPSGEVVLAIFPGAFSEVVPSGLRMRWSR